MREDRPVEASIAEWQLYSAGGEALRSGQFIKTRRIQGVWQVNAHHGLDSIAIFARQPPVAAAYLQNTASIARQHILQVALLLAC